MKMNREEVLARAEELGIELSHKAEKTTSVAQKIEDLTGEKIELAETGAGKAPDSDMIRCIIHSNDKDNDEYEAYFGMNGENVKIILGEEVDFPKKFLSCVTDAVADEKIAILGDDGQPTGKYKERKRKNYILERV